MSNLFKGWPKDKLAVASSANLFNDIDTSVCEIYYQLSYNNKLHPFPLGIVLPKIKSGLITLAENNTGGQATESRSGNYKRIYKNLFSVLNFLGLYNILYKQKITSEFEKWLQQYNPDIIYTQLATFELISFTGKIQKLINKPVVIHMMDDWPSTISTKGLFKNTWHRIINKELQSLINRAGLLLSISETMAREYEKRYGKNFITFHNPIEIEFWKSHQRRNYTLSKDPVILYAGRIGKGINTTLETIAIAVNQVNSTSGFNIQFLIQAAEKPSWIIKYKHVYYRAPVAYSELPKVFAEADFLYLPYDFSAESIRFIKYSMPTKAPEYMASGTPIIMFAPGETDLVINAQKGCWAKVVTENKIELLSNAISQLINSESERKQIAENAVRIAESNFDSNKIRNHFKELISSL